MLSKCLNYSLFLILLFAIIVFYFAKKGLHQQRPSQSSKITIVPHPQEIGVKNKLHDFLIDPNTVIIVNDKFEKSENGAIQALNAAIADYGLSPLMAMHANQFKRKNNAIVLAEWNNSSHLLDSLLAARKMMTNPPFMKAEEYRIDVDSSFVVILAHNQQATFFGIQTLIQLFEKSIDESKCKVRAVRIRDFPDMPVRSTYYGFHLKDLDNDSLVERGYEDILKFAKYKFNMIGLDNHHYSHLDKEIPGGGGKKYWERFNEMFNFARKYHLEPRVGGWTRWFDKKHSEWDDQIMTLEGIRTTQKITMIATDGCTLRISSDHIAKKVIHDISTGKSWDKEPVSVTDESGKFVYVENVDYKITFGKFDSPFYDTVISGEGEPEGYPLRRGESKDPPTTIRRTEKSRIEDGQTVKVSFTYIGADPWSPYKFRYCRSDPSVHTDSPDNYIWRWCTQPIEYLNTKIFNLEMDEIRVFGWDKRCLDSGKSRSQIFADDIKYYYDTIRKKAPDAQIFMWSDMIDPNHNASTYENLDVAQILIDYKMDDIIMVPWNHSCAEKSIEFLFNKGFPVVASSQEFEGKISFAPKWAKILRERFIKSDRLHGLIHAPWEYDYDSQDGLERLRTTADHAWSIAPYIIHLPVQKAHQGENILIAAGYEGDAYIFDGQKVRKGSLPLISAYLCYRKKGDLEFQRLEMNKNENRYVAKIPGVVVTPTGVDYYIEMTDKFNTSVSPKSAPDFTYFITVR